MPRSEVRYTLPSDLPPSVVREDGIESGFIGTLQGLKYHGTILINGVPVTQIELKTLGVNPRRAMEQIVSSKNDPGNGYTKTLLCFLQLFRQLSEDCMLALPA